MKNTHHGPNPHTTSWQHVGKWYNEQVGFGGHYYHQHVVIPNVLKLLKLTPQSCLLDLACGQGVLARSLPPQVAYQGIDIARNLIADAQKLTDRPNTRFALGNITKPLPINKRDFTHAAIILALQNIEELGSVFANVFNHLNSGGKLVIVMNHPCFRIPRQSSWGIDEQNKTQYRRIDHYSTSMKIPITASPSRGQQSPITWSFHFSIDTLSNALYQNGFVIEKIEEWSSDKQSHGRAARMENRSRSEIPLFMAFLCQKWDKKGK